MEEIVVKSKRGRKKDHSSKKDQLEKVLGDSFANIIDKNFRGMTRVDIHAGLQKMIAEKGAEIKFQTSSVWNWIMAAIKKGELKDFSFFAKRNESGRRESKIREVKAEKNPAITLSVTFICRDCGDKHVVHGDMDPSMLSLRVHKCRKCGKYSTCSAEFTHNGTSYRKMVVPVYGSLQESFVNEKNEQIQDPFEETTAPQNIIAIPSENMVEAEEEATV